MVFEFVLLLISSIFASELLAQPGSDIKSADKHQINPAISPPSATPPHVSYTTHNGVHLVNKEISKSKLNFKLLCRDANGQLIPCLPDVLPAIENHLLQHSGHSFHHSSAFPFERIANNSTGEISFRLTINASDLLASFKGSSDAEEETTSMAGEDGLIELKKAAEQSINGGTIVLSVERRKYKTFDEFLRTAHEQLKELAQTFNVQL